MRNRTLARRAISRILGGGAAVTLENFEHYWSLNEESDGSGNVTRNDSIGTIHLTSVNTVPSAAGLSPNTSLAASFDTVNSERIQNTSPTGVDNQHPFFFHGWVRFDAFPGNMGVFGIANQLRLFWQNSIGRFEWLIYPNTSTPVANVVTGAITPVVGVWTRIYCGVRAGGSFGQAFLKINEDAEITANLTAAAVTNANKFEIGARGDSDNFMTGLVDEVGYGATELTEAQLAYLYNAGLGRGF